MNERERAAGMCETPGYRYAEVVGDQLFVAGQVPRNGAAELVGVGDAGWQTRQCLDNLFTVIEAHGFDRSDIRHLTLHVVGEQSNLSTAWAATRDAFDGEVPPATLLGCPRLGYEEQLVEIDAVIVRG